MAQVKIRSGKLIDLIEFVMADGKTKSWGSQTGGTEAIPFDLAHDELIVGVLSKILEAVLNLSDMRCHPVHGRFLPVKGIAWMDSGSSQAREEVPIGTVAVEAHHRNSRQAQKNQLLASGESKLASARG